MNSSSQDALIGKGTAPASIEAVRSISERRAVLKPEVNNNLHQLKDMQEATRTIGQRALILTATTDTEIDTAFATLAQQRVGALMVVRCPDFPAILVLLEGQTAPGLPFLRRLHWIISSEKDVAKLFDAASGSSTRSGELWRYTSPYPGLAAMEEKDS